MNVLESELSESRHYMLSTMGPGREGNSADNPPGGNGVTAPYRRRQVGEDTIHEGMVEGPASEGAAVTGTRELRKSRGPVDSVDCQIHVSRPAYTVSQLRSNLCYAPPEEHTLLESAKGRLQSCVSCSPGSLLALLLLRVPILASLPRYSPRKDLVSDIIAGITVAVMHLPQGMAYAMLADVPPIFGLYTAFFPVLAYAFFGTSPHVSMGTFAVACLMTGKVVGELSTSHADLTSSVITIIEPTNATDLVGIARITNTISGGPDVLDQGIKDLGDKLLNSASVAYALNSGSSMDLEDAILGTESPTEVLESVMMKDEPQFTNVQVAMAVTCAVGMWQVVFGLLQLGQVCVFLSDMLISGFTTGAACHVLSSQIKHIFGISTNRYSGPFRLIYTYIDIFSSLSTINPTAVIMSAVCITVLALNNEILKPRVKKYTNFPIPIELIVVIVGTVVSYLTQFEETHDLGVVGDIPTGLPEPVAPDYRLFVPVLVDSFVLAIVIYAISFSMCKIFSKKHGYKVDATQELYAGGISNIFGSFFSSLPSCTSLSRSLIQESVGAKSMVTSFVSCTIILIVLLFVGPVFESLPNCVLASIILVALKGMFMQVYDFLKMWKQSKPDALLWVVSFLVTVLVDIDYGLGTGVLISLLLLLKRNNQPTVTRLGWIPKTDIYVDIDTYQSAVSVPGACLCRVSGALHFANLEYFKEGLMQVTGIDTVQIIAAKAKREKVEESESRSAALHNLPTGEEGVTPQGTTPTVGEQGDDKTKDSTGKRKDQVIVIENSSHNLTKEVIREALVNAFKRSSSSSYACEDDPQAGADKRKTALGQENKAYLPDELYETYSTPKARPMSFLKRFSHTSKGLLVPTEDVSFVVLCLSGVGWIDVSAAKMLRELFTEHGKAGISLALAGANDSVMQVLRQCGVLGTIPAHRLYHSLHDAVTSLMPDVLHSKPQPPPFVGDGSDARGPLPTTHDARPAVVPATLHGHSLRPPTTSSGVPSPMQSSASPAEYALHEDGGVSLDPCAAPHQQTQGSFAQSQQREENGVENDERKRATETEDNLQRLPTSGVTLQPEAGDAVGSAGD